MKCEDCGSTVDEEGSLVVLPEGRFCPGCAESLSRKPPAKQSAYEQYLEDDFFEREVVPT